MSFFMIEPSDVLYEVLFSRKGFILGKIFVSVMLPIIITTWFDEL